jgi:hypothetical protein
MIVDSAEARRRMKNVGRRDGLGVLVQRLRHPRPRILNCAIIRHLFNVLMLILDQFAIISFLLHPLSTSLSPLLADIYSVVLMVYIY